MEQLILTCGRFIPVSGGGAEARIKAMEDYLARLSEEMELLVSELGRAVESLRTEEE